MNVMIIPLTSGPDDGFALLGDTPLAESKMT